MTVTVRQTWISEALRSEYKVLFDSFSFKKKNERRRARWTRRE